MGRKIYILIVDDNADLALSLRDILETQGYNTTVAHNAETALALCRERVFDIGIIDIKLPDMSGMNLTEKIDKLLPGVNYIIITGYASLESAIEAAGRDNVVAYVTKPLNIDHLLALTRQVVKRKRAEQGLRERVKELQCLYGIDRIAARAELTVGEICQEVVNLLQSSWQYPEVSAARITINGKKYETKNCKDTKWKQSSDIKVHGAKAGAVEVMHLENRPETDEGPFQREERLLIDSVAEQLARIIEGKQAEAALRESEERYRALVNLGGRVGEAIIMRQDTERGEGTHIYVSDEWTRITGYSENELLGMSFFDLVHPKYRQDSMNRYRRRMKGEIIPGFFEISIIRKDGTEVPIELTSAYTTYKGKRASVAFIREITERRKMQEQLILTDRLASIGELSSGIAHELNNPLTSVIGFSELVLAEDVPDDVKEDLKIINREAKRAAGVVKNLLIFARGHLKEKGPVTINKVIQTVLALRMYEQKVNNIQVNTQFASNLPEISGDSFQLQQVFINIVINAEHFMSAAHGRGTLTITTEQAGNIIRASFADDGPGIAKEHLGHLFDPFFTTKEVGKGTGLGLSICHGIITEHGGRIYAESELGKGATFTVELPISSSDRKGVVK